MPGVLRKGRDVRGDRVGRAALRDGGLGHSIIEAAAAVADIKDDAALFGGQRRRQQPAVLDDVGEIARQVRRTRIGVGQDVARPQQIEDLGHQRAGLDAADVHHNAAPGSGLLADTALYPKRLARTAPDRKGQPTQKGRQSD